MTSHENDPRLVPDRTYRARCLYGRGAGLACETHRGNLSFSYSYACGLGRAVFVSRVSLSPRLVGGANPIYLFGGTTLDFETNSIANALLFSSILPRLSL